MRRRRARPAAKRSPRFGWLVWPACVAALETAALGVRAEPGAAPMYRVEGPGAIAYVRTSLGRATHRVRIVIANPTPQPVALPTAPFRYAAMKDGVTFRCEERYGERLPTQLDPGRTLTIERAITCDTPLPGLYDIVVRAGEQLVGSAVLQIGGGPNAPVQLPWDTQLYAASDASEEMRPWQKTRVVVAMINGTKKDVPLTPQRAIVQIAWRGSTRTVCPPEVFDLPFSGTLSPGQSRSLAASSTCTVPEGYFDVAVDLLGESGRVHVGTYALRVANVPVPVPGPTQNELPATMTP